MGRKGTTLATYKERDLAKIYGKIDLVSKSKCQLISQDIHTFQN